MSSVTLVHISARLTYFWFRLAVQTERLRGQVIIIWKQHEHFCWILSAGAVAPLTNEMSQVDETWMERFPLVEVRTPTISCFWNVRVRSLYCEPTTWFMTSQMLKLHTILPGSCNCNNWRPDHLNYSPVRLHCIVHIVFAHIDLELGPTPLVARRPNAMIASKSDNSTDPYTHQYISESKIVYE